MMSNLNPGVFENLNLDKQKHRKQGYKTKNPNFEGSKNNKQESTKNKLNIENRAHHSGH
jgi:hypothetical protein